MRVRFMAACTFALAIVLAPQASRAELLEWDQSKVTALGSDLARTMSDARQTALLEPTLVDPTPGSRQSAQRFLRTMRSLETSTRQLAKMLESGKGREETLNTARKIGTLLRNAQQEGRRVAISQTLWDKITPLVAVIDKMSPYYTDESPLMPRTLNPPSRDS